MSDKEEWKRQLEASIDAFAKADVVANEPAHVRQGGTGQAFPKVDPAAAAVPPAAKPAPAAVKPPPAPEPVRSIAPSGSGSLLDRLKKQAEEKLASETREQNAAELRERAVGETLAQVYGYLAELCAQLNVLRQPWSHPMFVTDNVSFSDLQWAEGRADYRKRTGPAENQPMERVSLRFKMLGPQKIELERENPGMETLRKLLIAQGIPFELDEIRNAKGYTEKGKFVITPEIRAGMLFVGNFETGDLNLKVLNLPRLGSTEYLVPIAELTPETLEEIALLAVGEPSKFFVRFKRLS